MTLVTDWNRVGSHESPVHNATKLTQREFGRRDAARRELGRDPLEDLVVGAAAATQLGVPSPYVGIGRFGEVSEHVIDHPRRLAQAERCGAGEVVDEILVPRGHE